MQIIGKLYRQAHLEFHHEYRPPLKTLSATRDCLNKTPHLAPSEDLRPILRNHAGLNGLFEAVLGESTACVQVFLDAGES